MSEHTTHIHAQARLAQVVSSTDKRRAMQFRTRKEAADCARAIHWPAKSPIRIEIMGFYLWALADDHMRYLTHEGLALLLAQNAA